MKTMNSLDLFSGIGGLTHALRGLGITPVGYCDCDTAAVAVLKKRMECGDLPEAPIHADVATLTAASFDKPIDILMGGFPCTGLSTAGLRQGFDNPGTGLYKHILRLANELRPRVIFLENVAAIRTNGLEHVVNTLVEAGYVVSWVSLRGYHVGAPQHRPRWFCLATTPRFQGTLSGRPDTFTPFDWETPFPPSERVIPVYQTPRMALLGNSVIPDVVRFAFLYLWTGSTDTETLQRSSWEFKLPAKGTTPSNVPPACGMALDAAALYKLAPPKLKSLPESRRITLNPAKYPGNAANPNRCTEPVVLSTWATPRRSLTHPSITLTHRVKRDLPTQIRFAEDTPDDIRHYKPNPQFAEYLLGFPRDWTLA